MNKVLVDLIAVVVIFALMGITVFAENIVLRMLPALFIFLAGLYWRTKTDRENYKFEKVEEALAYCKQRTSDYEDINDPESELGEEVYSDVLDKSGLALLLGNPKQQNEAWRILHTLLKGSNESIQKPVFAMRLYQLKAKLGL